MTEQQPDVDNTPVFEQLWGITNELRQKLDARFEVHLDVSTKELQNYSAQNAEVYGSLNTFSGSEIDWLVHQWARKPKSGFNYIRLVIWLGSHIRVPHLAFEFATFGHLFFYMDYIPRTDLSTDLEYLDRYYESVNQTYLNLQEDSRFQPFISKSLYIRQVLSPTCLLFTCPVANETLEFISNIAFEMMNPWLRWVDEAEPVPESERTALSKRDLIVRRAVAERDPGNENSVRLFGEELTDKLVRSLWGGDRILKSGS
ncbi:red chlorophyll catabolite reductase [Nostoc sp. T09]|uniref:red chlorophyll catabolite reductase n=1 Tax=Nostoc sp. T09 TaxID=1932621 RepID=UPI000A3AA29E|nr:red chlorophyll catabolite reductase [Nostoc sp. T09]OUL34853.1 red chlorophyll catabolite reductase [Nostoc sp. T09]